MADSGPADLPSAHLSIKLMDGSGNEMFFKIKWETSLKKVMIAWGERSGKDWEKVRFLIDGVRILPEHTPKSLDMEDGDTIQVHWEQIGGC